MYLDLVLSKMSGKLGDVKMSGNLFTAGLIRCPQQLISKPHTLQFSKGLCVNNREGITMFAIIIVTCTIGFVPAELLFNREIQMKRTSPKALKMTKWGTMNIRNHHHGNHPMVSADTQYVTMKQRADMVITFMMSKWYHVFV